jgi:hypothetical protein
MAAEGTMAGSTLTASMTPDRESTRSQFFFRYDYLDENRNSSPARTPWAGTSSKIDDPSRAAELDKPLMQCSRTPVPKQRRQRKKASLRVLPNRSVISAHHDCDRIHRAFHVRPDCGQHDVQSVRERTSELAVLKTLGFNRRANPRTGAVRIIVVTVGGGGLGLIAAWLIVQRGDPTGQLPFLICSQRISPLESS